MDHDTITNWTGLIELSQEDSEGYSCANCNGVDSPLWAMGNDPETEFYCRQCAEDWAHSNMQIDEAIATGYYG